MVLSKKLGVVLVIGIFLSFLITNCVGVVNTTTTIETSTTITTTTTIETSTTITTTTTIETSTTTSTTIAFTNPSYFSITNDGVISNTSIPSDIKVVVIPDVINNIKVTGIGERAFYYNTNVTSITIPSSVTSIGSGVFTLCKSLTSINVDPDNSNYKSIDGVVFNKDGTQLVICPKAKKEYVIPSSVTSISNYAFYYCINLISVTIPSTVTSIGNNAFTGCEFLYSITIPSSVKSISIYAFTGCTSLASINVDPDNSNYKSIDGVVFNKDGTQLILCPKGKSGEYTIPLGATSIGDYAFSGCLYLTSITIPLGVTSINSYAFRGYTGLTSINIPSSVTSIDIYAFFECTNLTSINVDPDNSSYKSIDGVVFNKDGTQLVVCPIGKKGDYTIPSGVTSIGEHAFWKCRLSSITIPSSVTSIGGYAFESSSLGVVTVNASLPPSFDIFYHFGLKFSIFDGCLYLKEIKVPAESLNAYKSSSSCWYIYADKIVSQ